MQVRQIADSIEEFGVANPVLIDGKRTILACHGCVAAAQPLGMVEVPCLRLDHMSASEKRIFGVCGHFITDPSDGATIIRFHSAHKGD